MSAFKQESGLQFEVLKEKFGGLRVLVEMVPELHMPKRINLDRMLASQKTAYPKCGRLIESAEIRPCQHRGDGVPISTIPSSEARCCHPRDC